MSRTRLRTVPIPLLLLVATALGTACGPRPDAAAPPIVAGELRIAARFEPDPPQPGENALLLEIRDAAGRPVPDARVRGEAVMAAMGTMPETRSAAEVVSQGDGGYRLALELGMAGSWSLDVHVEAPERAHARLRFEVQTGVPARLVEAGGEPPAGAAGEAGEIEYYTCSMHPSVRAAAPGQCPICGMTLVPVLRSERAAAAIVLDAQRRQQIGIRTAPVLREEAVLPIRARGTLGWDETRLTDVSLKFSGWIGRTRASYLGTRVRAGEPLFDVYSPELLSAQEELLEGERRASAGSGRTLAATARRRLRLWGLRESQIDEIVRAGRSTEFVPILSPVDGTVIDKQIVDGTAVSAGQLLYRIADPSRLWVYAAIYEQDVPLVEVGQSAEIVLTYLPGERFAGKVSWIQPYLDPASRTGRVRIELDDPDGRLRPEMFASVELRVALGAQLLVPEEAILVGGRSHVVFVDRGEGRLEPREVVLGLRTPRGYVVESGLAEGEVVVTSGNFLLASESRLKSGLDVW